MSTNFNSDKIRSIKLKDKIYNIVGQPLHGTAAEWSSNDFTPQQGELVVYDADGTNAANVKIGDGATALSDLPFVHTDGDNKEIYGVDANKDGNVELIFGISPSIDLISFHIDGNTYDPSVTNTYQAENGMTWLEWVNSEYNTVGFEVHNDMIHSASRSGMLYDETGSPIFDASSREIIANGSYSLGM